MTEWEEMDKWETIDKWGGTGGMGENRWMRKKKDK